MLVSDWAHTKKFYPGGGLCFRDLLIRSSLPANSIVRRTCLARAGELSSRRVFIQNEAHKTDDIPATRPISGANCLLTLIPVELY